MKFEQSPISHANTQLKLFNFTVDTAIMNFPHGFEPNNRIDCDSHNIESDDDNTIAIAVGGTTAFVAVFQEMVVYYYNNASDSNDGDSDSAVAEQRN